MIITKMTPIGKKQIPIIKRDEKAPSFRPSGQKEAISRPLSALNKR